MKLLETVLMHSILNLLSIYLFVPFLCCLVWRLRGHFGELSMHSSGSFTVEKCFTVGNLSLREAIVTELVAVQSELSKTKQGPYLIRKLDVDR